MRAVQVIPSFNVGGGELLAVRLCAAIKRKMPSSELFIVSLYDKKQTIVYDEAVDSGAIVRTLGKSKGFDGNMIIKLYRLFKELQPDIIHTHLAGLRYSIFAALPFQGRAKIHTVHNMAVHEAPFGIRKLHKIAFRLLDWTPVALSPAVKGSIAKEYGIDAPVIINGIHVDESVLDVPKELLRKNYGIPENHFVMICIGRLYRQKNQSLLVDVFENVFKNVGNCSLLIVGEDPEGGSYRGMLEEKVLCLSEEIRGNIHFLGLRKDIPQLLRASDLFILTSAWEGIPLTLLEAMGYGVPSVCTAVGGIPDMLMHEKEGLLVPNGNEAALTDAVLKIVKDPNLAARLSANAKKKFDLEYRVEIAAERYIDLYKSLLDGYARGGRN